MSKPRRDIVDPSSVQILHVFNRCVRRAFLCGVDSVSGKDYSHRKTWIRLRLEFLTGIFAFDIATYAVMSNHFHLVLRSRPDVVDRWSDEEVAVRNMRLQGKSWFRSDGTPRRSAAAEIDRITKDPKEIQRLRRKLSDVSKLMSYFDRNLAVRANREDEVSGAFWEGTFKAEPIKDEASLLACMTYVDLNPIRAMMAKTLEESDYTGVHDRICELRREVAVGRLQPTESINAINDEVQKPSPQHRPTLSDEAIQVWEREDHHLIGWLAPIQLDRRRAGPDPDFNGRRPSRKGFLSISLLKYLEVVQWAGREIVPDKRGNISHDSPFVLSQLGIEGRVFVQSIRYHSRDDRYFAATERAGIPDRPFESHLAKT